MLFIMFFLFFFFLFLGGGRGVCGCGGVGVLKQANSKCEVDMSGSNVRQPSSPPRGPICSAARELGTPKPMLHRHRALGYLGLGFRA